MTWFLNRAPQGEPLPRQVPSRGEQMIAGFRSQQIEDDAWARGRGHSRALRAELIERLGGMDALDMPGLMAQHPHGDPFNEGDYDHMLTLRVLERAAEAAGGDPGSWANLPTSSEDFEAEVLRRRRAEWDEQQAIMELGHSRGAQITGQFAGAAADEVTVLALPFGFASAGPRQALRFMATEAAIGAGAEAAILPRAQQTAEELGLPEPDALLRVAMGAGIGAGFAGMMSAGARTIDYYRARRQAEGETRPAGVDGLDFEAQSQSAELELRGGSEGMTGVGMMATQRGGIDTEAPALLGTFGSGQDMNAMVRLPDGTRLSGLRAGDSLPDGSRIAAIEDGRISIEREGSITSAGIGEAIATRDPQATLRAPQGEGAPPSFDFSPGGNAGWEVNPVGYAFGRFLELGYEPREAAALVGNLMQESGPGLNTRAVGDGGNAFGVAQWNGPRRRAYLAYAEARGRDAGDIDTQIAFLHYEMQTSERAARDAIRAAPDVRTTARVASDRFWRPGIPHIEARMAYAEALMRQYESGQVPRFEGAVRQQGMPGAATGPRGDSTPFDFGAPDPRRPGMTRHSEITSPAGTRVEVEWEVVDLSSLRRATGDLQPRDRTRGASAEQINEIAAGLDAARLMPSAEGDRGAPIVGPDSIIESGNGRVAAIARAAERHPERYAAYLDRIRSEGFEIPEGMERPVLVARRRGDMDAQARRDWVRENNTSAIARMSGSEQASLDADYLTQAAFDAYRRGAPLAAPEQGEFLRRMLANMPQAERAALYTADGRLSAEGLRRVRLALFARAWGADDLLRMLAEAPSPELRALIDMLDELAPEWAAFRAQIDAGMIRAEFDITEQVVGIVRVIGRSRADDRAGQSVIAAIRDHLAQPDMFRAGDDGLNEALLRAFYRGNTARRPEATGDILRRYIDDATLAGRADSDDLFAAPPPPREVLASAIGHHEARTARTIPVPPAERAPPPEPEQAVQMLPQTADGAASPVLARLADATEADIRAQIEAPFGPVMAEFSGDWRAAVRALLERKTGEVPNALAHPEAPPISLVYGEVGQRRGTGYGLAKIAARHPEVLDDLQGRLLAATRVVTRSDNRIRLESEQDIFVIALDYRGEPHTWLLTGYEKKSQGASRSMGRAGISSDASSASALPSEYNADRPDFQVSGRTEAAAIEASEFAALRDLEFQIDPDGPMLRARDVLDDLEADANFGDILNLCARRAG
ncbi:MAG: phage tail tip lysozyme [Pararhodobacter sp.]